jgi:hypothetical protein
VGRLLGNARASPEAPRPSLYARAGAVSRTDWRSQSYDGRARHWRATSRISASPPDADPREARREQALIQTTAAKIVMTRRKTEELRAALVDRDRSQAEIGQATADIIEQLGTALDEAELREAIAADLGDLQAEALRVDALSPAGNRRGSPLARASPNPSPGRVGGKDRRGSAACPPGREDPVARPINFLARFIKPRALRRPTCRRWAPRYSGVSSRSSRSWPLS